MIEAVNSVLASAPLVRQYTEQQSGGALSNNSQVESVKTFAQAPYISPFISVDVNFDTAVILLRDAETGDTVRQIPSEGALEARRREQVTEQTSQQSPLDQNVQPVAESAAPVETAAPVKASAPEQTVNTPISQNALSAFASGAQAATAGENTSFQTSA